MQTFALVSVAKVLPVMPVICQRAAPHQQECFIKLKGLLKIQNLRVFWLQVSTDTEAWILSWRSKRNGLLHCWSGNLILNTALPALEISLLHGDPEQWSFFVITRAIEPSAVNAFGSVKEFAEWKKQSSYIPLERLKLQSRKGSLSRSVVLSPSQALKQGRINEAEQLSAGHLGAWQEKSRLPLSRWL